VLEKSRGSKTKLNDSCMLSDNRNLCVHMHRNKETFQGRVTLFTISLRWSKYSNYHYSSVRNYLAWYNLCISMFYFWVYEGHVL